MGKINGIKQFQFSIEIDGLEQFRCQTATLPDLTTDEAEHTEGNLVVRTPGLARIGDLTLGNLIPSDTADDWATDLFKSVNDIEGGFGNIPELYLITITIRMYDNAGNTKNTWEYKDCWMKQLTGIGLDKGTSDNIIQEAIFVTNGFDKR